MYDITSTDYDEKEGKAYAEVAIELNIAYHLLEDLRGAVGFEDGINKNAKFQNFEVEVQGDWVRIWFQIEQEEEKF